MRVQTLEQFDLSVLPEQAQPELYDFYLFLKQRYIKETDSHCIKDAIADKALKNFLESNRKRKFYVDPSIDLSSLADEVNNMDF